MRIKFPKLTLNKIFKYTVLIFLTFNILIFSQTGTDNYGLTIINHGYQASGSNPFEWMTSMAEAIRDRAGQARILKYNKSNGYFEELPGYDSQGETILIFDWVTESDNAAEGFSEAAADALFSALILGKQNNTFKLEKIHFIGHSRGCSVNSETVERLLAIGIPVEQVTNLDPHDWGFSLLGITFPTDYDVNPDSLIISYPSSRTPNRGIVSWEGIGWIDTYWQTQIFGGRAVYGSYSLQLSAIGHSNVHEWYQGTIDGTNGDDSWYQDPYPARNESGYNYSRIGGLARPAEYGTREPVIFNFENEGFINGDFNRGPSTNQDQYPGWSEHGGGGTASITNHHLILDQTNSWREHNRFYIPENIHKLKYHLKVNDSEEGTPPDVDKFQLLIETNKNGNVYQQIDEEYTNNITDKWIETDISQFKNSIGTLKFNLIDGGGNGINSQVQIDSVSLLLNPEISVQIKIFLEGPYTNGSMENTLSVNQLLPLSQPFNMSPWNYTGDESVDEIPDDVVDWVLVELRDKTDNTIVMDTRAGFVLKNGNVVDLDGTSPLKFTLPSDDYYILVEHRNHLKIMSSAPITFN